MAAKRSNFAPNSTAESQLSCRPNLAVEQVELARALLQEQANRPRRRVMKFSEYGNLKGWSPTTRRRRKAAGLPVIERPGVPDYIDADIADAWLAGVDSPRHGR